MELDETTLPAAEIAALSARIDRPVVLVGMMGVGKSSVGRKLATLLHLPFIDADEEIERAAQMSIPEIFAQYGEAYFRDGERRVIARIIDGPGTRAVIATGGGAFVNAETRALILDKAIAVKNGFRVWAVIFPLVFTLMHRLWRPFWVLVALMGALGFLITDDTLPEWAVLLVDLLIGLYAGLAAADWIVTARERQGFVSIGLAAGDDEDEALAVFAHHWLHGQMTSAAAPLSSGLTPRAPQGPVIGLFPESGGR